MHPESSFLAQYQAAIAAGKLAPDAAQMQAAQAFEALCRQLFSPPALPRKPRLLSRKKNPPSSLAGLYLWGGVGRGKSMLMDRFVAQMQPHIPTKRLHFHAFMLNIHQRLFAFRQLGASDPLPRVIAELASECRILCLDEMQVHDVADAMILSRLFAGLMDAGICTVFTSNRPPNALYQGGLQREQFVSFIAMLEARLPILHLASANDYRLQQHRALQRNFFFPLGSAADDFLLDAWDRLTAGAPSEPLRIAVQGRVLRVDKQAQGVAWLTFDELCVRPLGASDYLALIAQCHTLLLQNIPALRSEDRNEAKRFVTLIDTLYDHRIKLVATAATAPEALYAQGDGHFEFGRTVSRLVEMQSDAYLALEKL